MPPPFAGAVLERRCIVASQEWYTKHIEVHAKVYETHITITGDHS